MLLVWAGMLDLVFKLAVLVTVYAKPIPSAHQSSSCLGVEILRRGSGMASSTGMQGLPAREAQCDHRCLLYLCLNFGIGSVLGIQRRHFPDESHQENVYHGHSFRLRST